MAIGFMANIRWVVVATSCLGGLTEAVAATSVNVNATLGSKALISVNGGTPKVVATGGQLDGVRVIAVQGSQVIVEVDGQRRTLGIGVGTTYTATRPAADEAQTKDDKGGKSKVVLTADSRGHFSSQASINGVGSTFMVDTGASVVTLSTSMARRSGVDLARASKVMIATANGPAKAHRVVLNKVELKGLTAHLVEAVVVEDSQLPVGLLGMSFLNHMNLNREGDQMTLSQRY